MGTFVTDNGQQHDRCHIEDHLQLGNIVTQHKISFFHKISARNVQRIIVLFYLISNEKKSSTFPALVNPESIVYNIDQYGHLP